MPRSLAALVSVTAVVAASWSSFVIVLPPLANVFVRLAVDLPAPEDIDAAIARLQEQVGTMPEGSAAIAVPIVTTICHGDPGRRGRRVRRTGRHRPIAALRALLATAAALLGLIVLPTWMLTVMGDKHRARNAVDRRLASWLRQGPVGGRRDRRPSGRRVPARASRGRRPRRDPRLRRVARVVGRGRWPDVPGAVGARPSWRVRPRSSRSSARCSGACRRC